MWEIRIPTHIEPGPGASPGRQQRSVIFRGTAVEADAHRAELIADLRSAVHSHPTPPAELMNLRELLEVWLTADHPWKPSTLVGYRSNVRALGRDPIARSRVSDLTPHQMRATFTRWAEQGATVAVVGGRFRVLRSAVGWAYDERILSVHPLRTMRGPGRPAPRRPIADGDVRALLATADLHLLEALANDPVNDTGGWCDARPQGRRHRAELDLLLVRLAADTGARRGELTALQIADLAGRTLRIDRAVSAGVVTTPKSGHGRSMTVGASTAALWHGLVADWHNRVAGELGPWLFTADLGHHHRLGAEVLGHRFAVLRDSAGVPDATLHRLRHSVATFLVGRGQILQAQSRLGHADAATTLREYAHALPLTDQHVADTIDAHLDNLTAPPDCQAPRAGNDCDEPESA